MKCGRSTHQELDYNALSKTKTHQFPGYANKEPVLQKRKFDTAHLKMTDLSLEEDSGNEYIAHDQLLEVLLDILLS